LTVAPAISILDRAIVSNASGLEPLVPCLINGIKTMLTKPTYFFKQPAFLFIWSVYSGTYTVANNIDAFCERSSRAPFYPKFIGTAVVNVTLCNLNEVAFARMFGTGARPPMSLMSSSLFATRDSLTCLSSFCLPDIVSQHVQASTGMGKAKADFVSQILTPVTMQIFSTPLHLYGLDLYNRPCLNTITTTTTTTTTTTAAAAASTTTLSSSIAFGASSSSQEQILSRMDFIVSEYVKTCLARMTRISLAFGIGGVVNRHMRKSGKDYLAGVYN